MEVRAGLYARVSREEQVEGYSIDAQIEAMRAFCASQGWEVAREYVEPGYTARTDDRPVFGQVLADCERHAFDVLVTHKLDRAFRSLLDQLTRLRQLDGWGVTYVSVVERIDYSTPHGKLFLAQLGALNQYFADNLSLEVKKGKRGRAMNGLSNASTVPYGYVRNADGLDVPDPEKAPAVQFAFETYATGLYTDQEIADMLNREGFRPYQRQRPGKPPLEHWTRGAARKMLTNLFYAGKVRYGDDLHPGRHEPLVSQELFDLCREVRARRGRFTRGKRRARGVYLLQNIARCFHCNGRMHMEYKRTRGRYVYQYYRCPAAINNLPCPVAGRTVRMDIIDAQVADLVGRLRLPDDWRSRLKEISGHDEERERVEGQRKYLEGKRRRLRELYLDGDVGRAEYDLRKAEIEEDLAALRVPDAPDVEAAGEALESLGDAWEGASLETRRDMLRVIFEAVWVDVAEKRLVCVRPYPPFVPLFRMDGMEERDGRFYRI